MLKDSLIDVLDDGKEITIKVRTILYVQMSGNIALIHVSGGMIYKIRTTLSELEEKLGEGFINIKRGCLVSAMAIHDVTDKVNLSNGENLEYAMRKKKDIITEFQIMQENMVRSFYDQNLPSSEEQYRKHYEVFETLPFAFTDIEMVFDERYQAIDWIFRYGNPALARLEKTTLDKLIGKTFSTVFANMDVKWLKSYERAAIYGETLKIIDYSPEIDTYLDIICFPTFKGHCGCILLDISDIKPFRSASDTERAMTVFLKRILDDKKYL